MEWKQLDDSVQKNKYKRIKRFLSKTKKMTVELIACILLISKSKEAKYGRGAILKCWDSAFCW